ncbi:low-affinity Zn(2+) transporter zrt2 [Trebouxia sp. C0009 RCD-2024]
MCCWRYGRRVSGKSRSASPEPDCFSPGGQGLLRLRLGGLFGILVLSAVGIFIPFLTHKRKLKSLFFLLRAFAAGVVLSTWFVHVLADAFPILAHPCLGLSTEYPWAMTFATAAVLPTFTLEWLLHTSFCRRLLLEDQHEAATYSDPEAQPATPSSVTATNAKVADRQGRIQLLENVVRSYIFEAGIIFHCIFIGITWASPAMLTLCAHS